MILAIIALLLVPTIVGIGMCKELNIAEVYAKGFLFIVSLFAVCYYTMITTSRSFTTLSLRYSIVVALAMFFGMIRCIHRRQEIVHYMQNLRATWISNRRWFIVVTGLILFHTLRVTVMEPFQLRDSITYNALINDTIHSNLFYGYIVTTGEPAGIMMNNGAKYILAPWYILLAYIARIFHIHALVVTGTVIPCVLLLLSYAVIWEFGRLIYTTDVKRILVFTFLCGVLFETMLLGFDQAAIMLLWPFWGKNLPAMVICPLIVIQFYRAMNRVYFCWADAMWILIFSVASCCTTAATIMVIPMELGLLSLIYVVRNRSLRPVLLSLTALIPVGLELYLFFLMRRAQIMI